MISETESSLSELAVIVLVNTIIIIQLSIDGNVQPKIIPSLRISHFYGDVDYALLLDDGIFL